MAQNASSRRARTVRDSRVLLSELKDFLIHKGFKPGDRLETEVELARRFKVSRARIREATNVLCQLGVLESRPRRGTIIKSFDPVVAGEHVGFQFAVGGLPLADSQEARIVVEQAIMPLVVRRITPSGVADLKATIQRMEAATSDKEVFDADRDFHLGLLKACGNQTLQAFSQVIVGLFDQLVKYSNVETQTRERSIAEHRELVRRIEEEDTEGAIKVLTRHLKFPAE
ncbi:MAG TPA: FCD domain-containing protein [Acidobacteriota bacterium]|nr:FCD domain-containing protein [Acidobacteriota bacterium]